MSSRSTTYTWLKKYIATLPRGEGVFLTEAEVAERAGTSRTPVREAFMRLESEGLLELIPRRGAYVPPLSTSEITMIMEARSMVEEWSIRQVIEQPTEGLVEELYELIEQQEQAVNDPVAFIDFDRAFHTHLIWAAGNTAIARFYEGLRDRQLRMGIYAVSANEKRSRVVVEEHRAIVRSIEETDPGAAGHHMSLHLNTTLQAMLNAPVPKPLDIRAPVGKQEEDR